MDYRILDFKIKGDDRGNLIALEANKEIPFDIKRAYYIFDTAHDIKRGCHAHIDLQQVAICLNGSCKFLLDDGGGDSKRSIIELNSPNIGLYIGNNIWREIFDFSYGAVLLVLASKLYDEKDYIRDYNDFLKSQGIK